jgi:serine phosphatase RsbU (regulator of sigma subunit)
MLPADVWFIGTLAISTKLKGPSVRWLLAPAVLYYGFSFLGHLSWAIFQLGWLRTSMSFDFALTSWPFPLDLSDILNYVFVLSLLIFLVRRFSAARQEEARLSQEIEAARSVQALLIPSAPPATPGFAVEHAYLPASEVGGDFFQVLPGDDGTLLIVVGDVSGKGLKAAMTVSAIVGALRGCTARAPAAVLAYLNRALRGQVSGFFTCCVALIEADGELTIANAGHLPPYLNGEEMAVDSGLPLGIADEAAYAQKTWKLGAGDRLTFVSDGVVEARDASGELYGFARTGNISRESAETIARMAQLFGQEDDITVLTVARIPKLEAVPA